MTHLHHFKKSLNTSVDDSVLEFSDYLIFFNSKLLIFIETYFPVTIQPMVHHMTGGGKRIRGIFSLLFTGVNIKLSKDDENTECQENIIQIAIIIELLHCLSLVIDDSPSMDNDDYRRNKHSFHKKYGIEKTNFFCYYLINKLIITLNQLLLPLKKPDIFINLIKSNIRYLLDGQCIDINTALYTNYDNHENIVNNENNIDIQLNKNQSKSIIKRCHSDSDIDKTDIDILFKQIGYSNYFKDELKLVLNLIPIDFPLHKLERLSNNVELNLKKTSSLFYLAIVMPVLYKQHHYKVELTDECIKRIGMWANLFGILFQYSDDMLDIEQDLIKGKPNITSILNKNLVDKFIQNGIGKLNNEYIDIINEFHMTYKELKLPDYPLDTPSVIEHILNLVKGRY